MELKVSPTDSFLKRAYKVLEKEFGPNLVVPSNSKSEAGYIAGHLQVVIKKLSLGMADLEISLCDYKGEKLVHFFADNLGEDTSISLKGIDVRMKITLRRD